MKAQHSVVVTAAVAVVAFASGHLLQKAEGADTAEARLRTTQDVQAIESLLVHYGRELDKRDYKAYGALFAQDGTWKGGMGFATGPEAIGKMVAAGFEKMSPSLYEKSYHSMTSFDVQVNGDAATAWSRWTWIVVGADGRPRLERAGHYEDTLVRERGEWKFKSRQAFTEIN
jgi:ketosteroid isomerase-like protein